MELDSVDHYAGVCDVCGDPLELTLDRRDGLVDIVVTEDGLVYTWMRHYATAPPGANPACAVYSSRVFLQTDKETPS